MYQATDENNNGYISVTGYNDGFEYVYIANSGEVYVRVTHAMVDYGIELRGSNATINGICFQSSKSEAELSHYRKSSVQRQRKAYYWKIQCGAEYPFRVQLQSFVAFVEYKQQREND